MNRSFTILPILLTSILAGCSSQDASKPAQPSVAAPTSGVMMAENRKHPLAKYLELVGFRPLEKGQGKLTIKFSVVNHSDADISDLGLTIGLRPTTAKPGDAPFCSFSVKLPSVAPQEIVESSGECATTLRVYELPDWQFIRATYQITSPSM